MISPILPYERFLGTVPDSVIAEAAGTNLNSVRAYRYRRGILLTKRKRKKGSGRPVVLDSTRSRILLWFQTHGAARAQDVAEALLPGVEGQRRRDIFCQVYRLFKEGKLVRLFRGMYAPVRA